jgi:hypothetical protein
MNLQILSLVCKILPSAYSSLLFVLILTLEIAPSVTGHVFAYGVTRSAAITSMSLALKEIQIRGEIHSNVDYTVDLLNVSNNSNLLNPTF